MIGRDGRQACIFKQIVIEDIVARHIIQTLTIDASFIS